MNNFSLKETTIHKFQHTLRLRFHGFGLRFNFWVSVKKSLEKVLVGILEN